MVKNTGLPKITSAMLVVTHACNLACRYCFVTQSPSMMTLDTAKQAAQMLIDNAVGTTNIPDINFFGGEPLIMWDSIIKPLVLWIREEIKQPFTFSMTSNCTLLDDERLEFMRQYDIGLLFSIDGVKAVQDYNRPYHDGRGSYDVLEPMIPKILAQYPTVTLRMTAIPPTCSYVFENIMWGEAQGYTNFFVTPNVFEEWDEASRATLTGEIIKYTDYFIDCCRQGKRAISFSVFGEALRDIRRINHADAVDTFRTDTRCRAEGKCGLGSSRFASIHPNGNIYGCQEMTSNEGEESLFYIGSLDGGVSDARRYALMAEFHKRHVVGEYCETCQYDAICDGGCVANNYIATGSLTQQPELFCWWRMLILDEAVRVMQLLGEEENQTFKNLWDELR